MSKSTIWAWRCADLWNDLGFSLCAVPFVCHVVAISENRKKSEMKVKTDLVCCCWILGIKSNKSLSLSIIRLANHSVTTSLIYKFLLLLWNALDTDNFSFLLFLWFYINFVFLSFWFSFGWWRGTWYCSHMTCHMMWGYKPRVD